jgi:hypothetical protein
MTAAVAGQLERPATSSGHAYVSNRQTPPTTGRKDSASPGRRIGRRSLLPTVVNEEGSR